MTLTNKDKILLGMLAVILFAGLMFAYGILPANEDLADLEAQISQKQDELLDLQNKLATINITGLENKYDELLEFYYSPANQPEGELPLEQTMVDINRKVVGMLRDNNLTGYSTTGWKKEEQTVRVAYDGYEAAYTLLLVNCNTPFETDNVQNVYDFVDDVRNTESMTMNSLSLAYDYENNVYSGSCTVQYLMKMDTSDNTIPKQLPEVANVTADGATVTFDVVPNAVKYEFYRVAADETGNKSYTLIKNATLSSKEESGQLSRKFTSGMFGAAGTYNVVVRAVGDKSQGWFKTPLGVGTEVTVTI